MVNSSFPPKQNDISVFKERRKENNNCNQDDDDDDDDDHGVEHLRHNRMFLDKKQGWYHITVSSPLDCEQSLIFLCKVTARNRKK